MEAMGLTEQPDLSDLGVRSPTPLDRSTRSGCTPADLAPGSAVPARAARPGETVTGPAIIAEANATTVVDDGWQATVTRSGICC